MSENFKSVISRIENILRFFVAIMAQIFCFFLFVHLVPIVINILLTSAMGSYSASDTSLAVVTVGVITGIGGLITIAAYVMCTLWLWRLFSSWLRSHRKTESQDSPSLPSNDNNDVPKKARPQKKKKK